MKKAKILFSLIVAMALQTVWVHADMIYSDVGKNYWAVPFIQKMSDLKIITGYANGKYGPEDKVNKYVAILVTYRTLDSQGLIAENEKTVLKNRYQAAITKYNVPNWPNLHEAVGFFIENDIIKPEDLEGFQNKGKMVDISRQDMSLYLGKALNIYFKDNINDIIIPKFKDHGEIEFTALKYVNILNNHNIISGNELGYFMPKANLTRAQLAKLLSVGVDELKKIKAVEDKKIKVKVQLKLDDTKHVVFYDLNSNTQSYREKIHDELEIMIDGKKGSYEDLKTDMIVLLRYKNDKLIGITTDLDQAPQVTQTPVTPSTPPTTTQQGTNPPAAVTSLPFKGVSNGSAVADGKKYIYIKPEGSEEVKFYELTKDAKVASLGQTAPFEKIEKDDLIEFDVKDGFITELDYRKPNQFVEGLLQSITIEEVPKISIKVQEQSMTYPIVKDALIERNGLKKTLADLIAGDQIKLELRAQEAVKISATGNADKELGIIEKVVLGNPNQIVIKDANGKLTTHKIKTNAAVFLDNKPKSLYDLRINYSAALTLESGEVSEIKATSSVMKHFVSGRIINKYEDLKVLIVEMNGSQYTVNIKEGALFLDAKGVKSSFDKMQIADQVFCYGVIQDKIMSAEKVFALE